MATIIIDISGVFNPNRFGDSTRLMFSNRAKTPFSMSTRIFAPKIRASSTSIATEIMNMDPDIVEKEASTSKNNLACPICCGLLTWNGSPGSSVDSIPGSSLQCSTCKKTYFGKKTHLDLTASSGAKEYTEVMPLSTELFRTPLISYIYERGWRQNFSMWSGFPGPEKEFGLIKEYLKPVLGGNIVDASCGSGQLSRIFARSGLFSLVVALDFSENMLRECCDFIEQEKNFPKENLILVRADICRLPFVSSSVDAVHAGAALHCWPSPSAAVAEISRVLRPGGVFVATTAVLDGLFSVFPFMGHLQKYVMQIGGSRMFLSESELEDLCITCGLVDFTCQRNGPFAMISARKSSQHIR